MNDVPATLPAGCLKSPDAETDSNWYGCGSPDAGFPVFGQPWEGSCPGEQGPSFFIALERTWGRDEPHPLSSSAGCDEFRRLYRSPLRSYSGAKCRDRLEKCGILRSRKRRAIFVSSLTNRRWASWIPTSATLRPRLRANLCRLSPSSGRFASMTASIGSRFPPAPCADSLHRPVQSRCRD